jgi:hypothetical protein
MKLSYMGAIVALSAATLLAACGGKAQYTVQGPISGLATPGLKLTNGGETITVPAGATSFAFARQIDYGTTFTVGIAQQPEHMACVFNNNFTGSAGHTVSISVEIICQRRAYTLSGQFTGLFPSVEATTTTAATVRTVTLLNGTAGGSVTVTSPTNGTGAGDFVFGNAVADGQAYGVTIHPDTTLSSTDISCTVKNGVGVMGEAAVSNLLVECKPK